jgi:hypothetical protein
MILCDFAVGVMGLNFRIGGEYSKSAISRVWPCFPREESIAGAAAQ